MVAYLVLKKMKKRKGGCKFGRKERKKKESRGAGEVKEMRPRSNQ